MQTDEDLPTLIRRQAHYHVLCYLRVHQIRAPELVIQHAQALLGTDLNRHGGGGFRSLLLFLFFGRPPPQSLTELARLAILEQTCLAALDSSAHSDNKDSNNNKDLAAVCFQRLQEAGVTKDSVRYRRLVARSLEAAGDYNGAELMYDELLQDNPANLMALRRKYCLYKAQVGKDEQAMIALNTYLQQNYADTAAWYEMAQYRLELGDYKSAAYCLEETLLGAPADVSIHTQLAEVYASIGGIEHLLLARKHLAQALELDPDYRRAQFGLVAVANAYLLEEEVASKKTKKDLDEHQVAVAKELVKYGADAIHKSYKGTKMQAATKTLMNEYVDSL